MGGVKLAVQRAIPFEIRIASRFPSKGVAAYKRENPGSKLKTAVTGDVKKGSKAAKRRKSFCARSKGWTGERGKAARRRWKC